MNIDMLHYWRKVLNIALELPGTEESSSYGTPACKVNSKLFARLWEDGKTLAVYSAERERWMKLRPTVYFITAHYNHHPMLLINLEKVGEAELKELVQTSWEIRAPRSLQKSWKENSN